ncbi:unnamed protein product [Effrenium voratum]|nr:unnamed protein product [Effrenium voratum]
MGQICCGGRGKESEPESRSPAPEKFRELRQQTGSEASVSVKRAYSEASGDSDFASMASTGMGLAGNVFSQMAKARSSPASSPRGRVSAVAKDASLNETGYKLVAGIRDKDAMTLFIERLIYSKGGSVSGEGAYAELAGIATWHSSDRPLASFQLLEEELERAAWASIPQEKGFYEWSEWYLDGAAQESRHGGKQPETTSEWFMDNVMKRSSEGQPRAREEYQIGTFTT